jgi:mannose-6-phosphate isomerase-like protein (cupin superfamily)
MILKRAQDLADEPVSHNPMVRKKVWLRKGESENITQISRATLPPGEACATHSHSDMWEFFLVESGEISFKIDGRLILARMGDSILIRPHESHELRNEGLGSAVVTVLSWTPCSTNLPSGTF